MYSYAFIVFAVLFFIASVILLAYWLRQFVIVTKENIKNLLNLNKEISSTGSNLSMLVLDNRKDHEVMKNDIDHLKKKTKQHDEQLEQLSA